MSENEWYGEPHVLVVRGLRLPEPGDAFDDGEFTDYDIVHPPSCREAEHYHGYVHYTCDVAACEEDTGLPFTLRYSGTPVTEPGTYRIQGWGRKSWYHEPGAWEYDGGVGIMDRDPEAGAS